MPFIGAKNGQKNFTEGGILNTYKYLQLPGIISFDDQIEGLVLKGVDRNFNTKFLDKYLVEGKGNIYADSNGRSILISQSTANRMRLTAGQSIVVHFVRTDSRSPGNLEVEGIYKTGLEEYDKKFAICDISVLQQLLHWTPEQYTGYEIFVDHLDDLNIINEYLYREILPENIYSTTIRKKFPGIFDWLQLQDYNEVVDGAYAAACLINMATMLIILILNRLRMIGILKTLGMKNKKISRIFLVQAGRIILWGLIWGNIFGIGLAYIQYRFKVIHSMKQTIIYR